MAAACRAAVRCLRSLELGAAVSLAVRLLAIRVAVRLVACSAGNLVRRLGIASKLGRLSHCTTGSRISPLIHTGNSHRLRLRHQPALLGRATKLGEPIKTSVIGRSPIREDELNHPRTRGDLEEQVAKLQDCSAEYCQEIQDLQCRVRQLECRRLTF